jgi:glycosyltransferase involved in cell wall biosynthesis
MKEILIALPNDTLGGAEQYLKMLANHYATQNYIVYVLFLKKKRDCGWEDLGRCKNVHLYYTNASTEKSGLIPFAMNVYLLRKKNFHFIYTSHVHLTGLLGFLIGINILRKKYFVARESTSVFLRFNGVKLFFFKIQYFLGYSYVDLLICQTDLMKNQLVDSLPRLRKKINIVVIPNPVNLSKINVIEDITNLQNYGDYLVSAGRLIPEKGFDILIDAFYRVKINHINLKLVILGEGSERKMLTDKIKELHLEDSVFLVGFVQNVYPYFKNAILSVVSSRIEGFPNVLLQMMSQNEKVVSTKCAGGIDEIEGVFTAETHNVQSLVDTILISLDQDTSENRLIFDDFLKKRTIAGFVSKVESFVNA